MADELTNYAVTPGHTLIVRGVSHPTGDVLPGWYLDWCGGLAAMVAAGNVAPTAARVNVKVTPPAEVTAMPAGPAMAAELERLRGDLGVLEGTNRELAGSNKEFRRQLDARDRALGEQTAEIDRLRGMLDQAQTRNEELSVENDRLAEAATAPAPKDKKAKAAAVVG